jgi:hypothetical protein
VEYNREYNRRLGQEKILNLLRTDPRYLHALDQIADPATCNQGFALLEQLVCRDS